MKKETKLFYLLLTIGTPDNKVKSWHVYNEQFSAVGRRCQLETLDAVMAWEDRFRYVILSIRTDLSGKVLSVKKYR